MQARSAKPSTATENGRPCGATDWARVKPPSLQTSKLPNFQPMRIVVKVGSNVVARPDGRLWIARMAGLADEVAALCDAGHQVLIVSSGAVAAGRGRVSLPKTVDRVARRQVLSAVGQAILIDTYRTLFDADGMDVGQILVTKHDLSSAEHAANLRQCVEAFFAYGIVPVVNENDTVSVEGLMFTDNDELAGLMAKLLGAQLLIVLSSVDGLCDGDPGDPGATLIREVRPGQDLSALVRRTKSSQGRGGMETKLRVAQTAAADGIQAVIANGARPGVVAAIVAGEDIPCTRFLPVGR